MSFVIGTFGTQDSAIFAAYEALAASLDNSLPGYSFSVQSYESYEAMGAAIASGEVDIAELGAAGFAAIVADYAGAATPLLTTLSPDGTSAYFSLGITPAESAITIEGLTTASEPITIGVVSTLSTSGFLAPLVELRDLGIDLLDPPSNVTVQILGSHEAVIAAVANGDIDLGFTWARGDAESGWLSGALPQAVAKNVIELEDIDVVWQSNPLLNGPIVVSADVPDASHDALTAAIETFTDANTEAAATMFGGAYHGLTEVSVDDYQIYIDLENLNEAPTGSVTITGSAFEGEVLTANGYALADADGLGTLSYQWFADGTAISGATGSTFLPGQAQVGQAVTVRVNYTDGGGTVESVISSATATVQIGGNIQRSASFVLPDNGYTLGLTLTGTGKINGTGNALDNTITGNSGNNRLDGGAGADILIGGAGNDKLYGGSGDDSLQGDRGRDLLNGGAGIDTVVFTGGKRTTVDLNKNGFQNTGHGKDKIIAVENVTSGNGADVLRGNKAANELTGNGGNDKLYGNGGNDNLYGGTGADSLNGGLGKDIMYAGVDNNSDVFIFNSTDETGKTVKSRDQIVQFDSGEDYIDLSGIDADTNQSGDQAFGYFGKQGKNFSEENATWYYQAGKNVVVRGDVDGDGKFDFEIQVNRMKVLVEDDFLL